MENPIEQGESWQKATEASRAQGKRRHSQGLSRMVTFVHAASAVLLLLAAAGVLADESALRLPRWFGWFCLASGLLPAVAATGSLWLKEVPQWLRVAASVSAVAGAVVLGLYRSPVLWINCFALGALAVIDRRNR